MRPIPPVPSTVQDPQLRVFLQQVRNITVDAASAIDVRQGNNALRVELQDIKQNTLPVNFAVPAIITNFEVTPLFGAVFLSWDSVFHAGARSYEVAFIEVWRNTSNDLENAELRLSVATDMAVDYLGEDESFYYWVRAVSTGGVPGPFNAFAGTLGTGVIQPAYILEQLEGQITSNQLYADLLARINLIDAPTTGLVAQAVNNANAIVSEALSRAALATLVVGADGTGLTTGLIKDERTSRIGDINQLSSQMALLTAGSNTQFDQSNIWYFDSTIESWTGFPTAPTIANAGFLRPANHASDSRIMSPTALAVDAVKYTQVRARVRRIGSPTWEGSMFWRQASDGPFSGAQIVTVSEPTWDAGGFGLVTFNPTWGAQVTIDQIRLDLCSFQDATNWIEIDWIAVGRPSPGASSAALYAEQLARAAADTANASATTALTTTVAGKASQSSVDLVTSRVTAAEGIITTQGAKITQIDSQLYPSLINDNPALIITNPVGNVPDGWLAWDTAGSTRYTGQYAYSGGNALQMVCTVGQNAGTQFVPIPTKVSNAAFVDVELVFTVTAGSSLSGAGVLFRWYDTLGNGYGSSLVLKDIYPTFDLNRKYVCKFRVARPPSFTGTFGNYQMWLMGNYPGDGLGATSNHTIIYDNLKVFAADVSATALQSLDSRVTSAEGVNSTQASQLTSLTADVAGKATITAVTALDARVTSAEGVNTSQASSITSLTSTVGGKADGAATTAALNSINTQISHGTTGLSATAGRVGNLEASVPGGGGNLIPYDTEFLVAPPYGWVNATRNLAGSAWTPYGLNQIGYVSPGQTQSVFDLYSDPIPLIAGKRYGISGYTASHRCATYILLVFYDASNNYTGEIAVLNTPTTGGDRLAYWTFNGALGVAPAGTAYGRFIFRGYRDSGQNDPYMWLCRPMVAEVTSTQTAPPKWAPSSGTAVARIAAEEIARADAVSALASYTNGINTTVNGLSASVQTQATSINGLSAQYMVKLDVNGYVSGFGLYNAGATSDFYVLASKFAVMAPGSTGVTPFVVDAANNRVAMHGAYIVSATITTAAIGDLQVTSAKMASASINDLHVGTLTVDKIIQQDASEDYSIKTTVPVAIGNGFTVVQSFATTATVRSRKQITFFTAGVKSTAASGPALVSIAALALSPGTFTPIYTLTPPWSSYPTPTVSGSSAGTGALSWSFTNNDSSGSPSAYPTASDANVVGNQVLMYSGSTLVAVGVYQSRTYTPSAFQGGTTYLHQTIVVFSSLYILASGAITSVTIYKDSVPYFQAGKLSMYQYFVSNAVTEISGRITGLARSTISQPMYICMSTASAGAMSCEYNEISGVAVR